MISFMLGEADLFNSMGGDGYKRPLHMLVDNQEPIFVMNACKYPRDRMNAEFDFRKLIDATDQLTENKGSHFSFAGPKSPFTLTAFMKESGYTFAKDKGRKPKIIRNEEYGYTDVSGNLEECSKSFHYRFYSDKTLYEWIGFALEADPEEESLIKFITEDAKESYDE